MTQIAEALEPFKKHDACDDCGKRTDGLMTCTYPHDGSITKLCPDCMEDSGFCLRCGNYSSGLESFDVFTDMPGYCIECRAEIKSEFDDKEDDDWDNGYDDFPYADDDPDSEAEDNNPNDSRNL